MTATTVGVIVALPVVCWLATAVRQVRAGQRVLVVRDGVVRRVHDTGLALRVPVVEQFVYQDTGPLVRPLLVRATTRDYSRIVLLGEAMISLSAPRPGDAYADPWPAAEAAAQETLAAAVADWSTPEVTRRASSERGQLRHAVSAAVDAHGVTLVDLDLEEVHVPVVQPVIDRGRT